MSADNGIIINRKTLKAYYGLADNYNQIIATGKDIAELMDNTQKWIADKQKEYAEDGMYFALEYGIRFIN